MKEYVNPLISIVVPIYNIEDYVEKCIVSIIQQSYENIEIILVDDGSTDKSALICDEFSKKDKRIKIIHKKNGGLVSARKAGISIATGDYVVNVDGDDFIEKNRLEHLANQISLCKADMIYMSGYRQDISGKSIVVDTKIKPKTYYGNEVLEEIMPLVQNPEKCFEATIRELIWMWGIKRELLQEKQMLVDNRISMGEDRICIWFCLLDAKSVALMQEDGYHYVQRTTSLTYSKNDDERVRMRIWYEQLKKYIEEHNCSSDIKKIFTSLCVMELLISDYSMLLLKDNNFLFPYLRVKKHSRIVVYGAGKFGCHVIRALDGTDDYQLVLWVDQNEERPAVLNYEIRSVKDILKVDYDYIVIAVIYEKTALEIKEQLLNIGVNEEKIAIMDATVIDEKYLEKVFYSNGN